MEVPIEVLQLLTCSRCESLLSCSPVYLCSDGEGLCNACFSNEPDLTVTRSTHYEAVAKLLLFPCMYQNEGCKVNIPFDNPAVHEEECPHRQIACPLQGSPVCEWFGKLSCVRDHCNEKHKDKVLYDSSSLTHDITKSTSHTYLLLAFDLFLLFTKVCVTSGKIYYSIRYIGSSSKVQNFKYNLTITREDETVIKKGEVYPQEILAFQEDSSLIINIDNLLGILGGFDGISFTVTMQQISLGEKCSKCSMLLKVKEYSDCYGCWYCEYCSPKKKICKEKECSYESFPEKLKKHYLFCEYYHYCTICKENVTGELLQHYDEEHYKYSNGSARRLIKTTNDIFLTSSNAGTAVCVYSWKTSNFTLCIQVPVLNDQLNNYRCKVKVIQLATGHIRQYTPKISYDTEYDWTVTVSNTDFNGWSDSFDISVYISKIK